ncbi:hypothetical protein D3C81_2160350 [compost metagenome]
MEPVASLKADSLSTVSRTLSLILTCLNTGMIEAGSVEAITAAPKKAKIQSTPNRK